VKAGLAHHHGDGHVLMVPVEPETQRDEAKAAAAAAVGLPRRLRLPRCGERATVALRHEQRPR